MKPEFKIFQTSTKETGVANSKKSVIIEMQCQTISLEIIQDTLLIMHSSLSFMYALVASWETLDTEHTVCVKYSPAKYVIFSSVKF